VIQLLATYQHVNSRNALTDLTDHSDQIATLLRAASDLPSVRIPIFCLVNGGIACSALIAPFLPLLRWDLGLPEF
jgi:hypothetical protein